MLFQVFRLLIYLRVQEQWQGDGNLFIEKLENKSAVVSVVRLSRLVCIQTLKTKLSKDKPTENGLADLLC